MKQKPNLPFWSLWNLSFGFFGVQIAYALQSANISRIFATLFNSCEHGVTGYGTLAVGKSTDADVLRYAEPHVLSSI